MTKRFAAHQVITSVNDRYKQYVVEVEGNTVSHIFPLTEEIAFTEWIGGIIILSSRQNAISHIVFPIQTEALIAILTENSDLKTCQAWHISPDEVAAGTVHAVRLLTADGIPHKR